MTTRIEPDTGYLVTRWSPDRRDFREPICPKCEEPVQWILDMQAHVNVPGGTALAHARCAWLPEAFDREKARSVEL